MIAGSRGADIVHYVNPMLANQRPRAFPIPARSVDCYPASSLARVSSDWQLPPSDVPAYALFVGVASPRKRLDRVAEMALRTDTRVVLVGRGTEPFAGPGPITSLGVVDDVELAYVLDRAGALLLVSSYEGFGIPIIEAAARGIASVVSAEVAATLPNSLSEFVVVTDPADPIAFSAAVREAQGRRGRSRFDAASLLDPLIGVYEEMLGRRPA